MTKIEEARARYEAADARLKALGEEEKVLPGLIEEAAAMEAEEKLRVALDGGNVATAAEGSKVAELKAREEALPYELQAAHTHRQQAYTDYLAAQLPPAAPRADATRADFEAAEEQLQKAHEAARRARDKHYQAATRAEGLRTTLRRERRGAE